MSREGQGKAKARSRRGQGKDKVRSRQSKHNLNRNYNLMGFDTIEINLVFLVNKSCAPPSPLFPPDSSKYYSTVLATSYGAVRRRRTSRGPKDGHNMSA